MEGMQIRIDGLEVYAYHGALPEEKVLGQPFLFDLVLHLEECPGAESDRVEDTVDYTEVIDLITEIATGKSFNLLEKLAGELGSGLLDRFPQLSGVEVTVAKPRPPIPCTLKAVAVHLPLWREEHEHERPALCYLGLGSNLGESREQLASAIVALDQLPATHLDAVSSVYRTAPVGLEDQPDFYNQVVAVKTHLDAWELLTLIRAFEAVAARVRDVRWGPRTLDIDILWYEGQEIHEAELEVPHPRLEERRFVLEPLAEIAPGLRLPSGRTAEEALAGVADQRVERLGRD